MVGEIMAYSRVSTTVSKYLSQQLNYNEEKEEIIAYGLEKLIITSLGFLAIIAVGFVLQVGKEVIAALAAGALLRKYSGGSHSATALGCIIYGAITYPAAAWLAHFIFTRYGSPGWPPLLIAGLIILAVINRYAPVDSPGKPIVSQEFRRWLHWVSLIVASIFILIAIYLHQSSLSLAIIAGLFLQTVSLLPIMNKRR